MGLPITPFIDLLNSILTGFCGYILFRSYQREPQHSPVLLFFSKGYFSLVFAYLFFSIPRIVVPENSLYLGIAFIIAQAFLFVAIAYFAKVTTFFISITWVPRVFGLVLFLAAAAIFLSIIYFGYPEYDPATSITDWGIHPIVGAVSILIFGGVLIPSMVFFFYQGARSSDHVVRIRSRIMAIGLLFLIVTATLYYTAETQVVALVSDVFSLFSFLIIFFGIVYKRERRPRVTPIP